MPLSRVRHTATGASANSVPATAGEAGAASCGSRLRLGSQGAHQRYGRLIPLCGGRPSVGLRHSCPQGAHSAVKTAGGYGGCCPPDYWPTEPPPVRRSPPSPAPMAIPQPAGPPQRCTENRLRPPRLPQHHAPGRGLAQQWRPAHRAGPAASLRPPVVQPKDASRAAQACSHRRYASVHSKRSARDLLLRRGQGHGISSGVVMPGSPLRPAVCHSIEGCRSFITRRSLLRALSR